MIDCPACGCEDVNAVELGDELYPDVFECESCGYQWEDPDHLNAG